MHFAIVFLVSLGSLPGMDVSISTWLERKAAGSASQRLLWQQALDLLLSAHCTPAEALRLADAAPDAACLVRVARLLVRDPQPQYSLDLLFEAIDASSSDLADWLLGLAELQAWLEGRGRSTTLRLAVGYLDCCAAANAMQHSRIQLGAMVVSMLEVYGFSGESAETSCS